MKKDEIFCCNLCRSLCVTFWAAWENLWFYLSEKPHGDQGQGRVLAAEAVVVGVEWEVVEVEELEPVAPGDGRVAANGVVLVSHPHNDDDVKRRGRVLEEFRHDCFHSCENNPQAAVNTDYTDMTLT